MKSRLFIGLFLLLTPFARAGDNPYDVLEHAYAPYMEMNDPLGFSMKVRSIASDPYKFWRGSKDLFFLWCKTNTTDWLADSKSFLPNHGDLHLGNIGTYAATGGWDKLAFGMVDFDDSARLPFQIELLQGLITLELTAKQNSIAMDDAASAELAKTLFESYRIAINSRRNATSLLVDDGDKLILKMLKRVSVQYSQELQGHTADGHFRTTVVSEKGKLKEVLRPAMNRADDFAAGIAAAIRNEPDLKTILPFTDAASVRASIKDIAQRSRLGSSGSQGLKKYLILLNKPIRGYDGDAILYLKQEIPSAAERAGVVQPPTVTPGERVKKDMDRLTDPLPYVNSWCDVGTESYWLSFKEPWSDELDPDDVKTREDLLHVARIWGTVVGAMHREEGRFEVIMPKLTPALLAQIRERSVAFVARLNDDFATFAADARVKSRVAAAEQAISQSNSVTKP